MQFHPTSLQDMLIVKLLRHTDPRGDFVKFFQMEAYEPHAGKIVFCEDFYSRSRRGVIRGMHFQAPPYAHWKLVTCVEGEICDLTLDMRRGSPTFGQWQECKLSETNPEALLIPPGIAHGFLSTSENSLVLYKTSCSHHASHDRGILWNSFGYTWRADAPILSDRDLSFPRWDALKDSGHLPTSWT